MFEEERGVQMVGVEGVRGRVIEEEVRGRIEGGNVQVIVGQGKDLNFVFE